MLKSGIKSIGTIFQIIIYYNGAFLVLGIREICGVAAEKKCLEIGIHDDLTYFIILVGSLILIKSQ